MHGSVNHAIEIFVRDTYGEDAWRSIVASLGLDVTEFEVLLRYPDQITHDLLSVLSRTIKKSVEEVLEDIGTYLVAHPTAEPVRRLLRFSGADFAEFLNSLDDLPARTRMVLPDLELPDIELLEHRDQRFSVNVSGAHDNAMLYSHVLMGLLRAMADDYGALVLMDHKGGRDGHAVLEIILAETEFAEGKAFALGAAL